MSSEERTAALAELQRAGRELSDATVLYHGVLAERLGLSPSQWKTLGILENHGSLSAGELASRSGLAPASMSGILDHLESKGLVRRSQDPGDRRRTLVELHAPGIQELYAAFGGLMRRLSELHGSYATEELHLIAGYLAAAAERQRAATRELQGEAEMES